MANDSQQSANATREQKALHPSDLKIVEQRARELVEQDKRRYDRVMAEIDKDERECLSRLRDIRMRRAVVQKAGHLK